MANFNDLTRYTNGQIATNRSGKNFVVLRSSLGLQPQADDTFIIVKQNVLLRPDLISYAAYGRPDLWWAIYEFNGISDPITGLSLGQTLRIPSLDRVTAAINNL